MAPIPRDTSWDATWALLAEGYAFIPARCRRYRSDIFQTRLMLRQAFCATGEEAARMFYSPGRFTRKGAMPPTAVRLLQDKGSVQWLDADAHRWRKQMFMALMTPEAIRRLAEIVADRWRARIGKWEAMGEVTLLRETQEILCRAVCQWAGAPLSESEAERRTRELSAMVRGAGAVGPRNWRGLLLRGRTERWARDLITQIRAGKLDPPEGSAARVIARYHDLGGEPLDAAAAAVELINVLRPTVAVTWFITLAAVALHEYPQCRREIQTGDENYLEWFAQEVRRFYPFFPFIGGRARVAFDWRDHHFAKGTWVLLDLYGTNHDARIWNEPEAFRPERFRDRGGGAFNFIPQGGGDYDHDHRCPGERITIELIKTAARLLTTALRYDVPKQDLRIDLTRIPALPASRFVIENIRRVE